MYVWTPPPLKFSTLSSVITWNLNGFIWNCVMSLHKIAHNTEAGREIYTVCEIIYKLKCKICNCVSHISWITTKLVLVQAVVIRYHINIRISSQFVQITSVSRKPHMKTKELSKSGPGKVFNQGIVSLKKSHSLNTLQSTIKSVKKKILIWHLWFCIEEVSRQRSVNRWRW